MVLSVTLGFMLYKLIRLSKIFKKKRPINMDHFFCFGCVVRGFCLCVCVRVNVSVFVCLPLLMHTYVCISAHIMTCIFTHIHIFPLSMGRGEAKEKSVRKKEWLRRRWKENWLNQNDFFFSWSCPYFRLLKVYLRWIWNVCLVVNFLSIDDDDD